MVGRIVTVGVAAALMVVGTVERFRASEPGTAQAPPRNIIFILSDDHRYDFMGFHPGAPDWLQTPALDRMAAAGAHLRNAFVTTALCSPSRASILTGRYAHRHGVVDNTSPIPKGTVFFPQYLQKAGYRTAYVGKVREVRVLTPDAVLLRAVAGMVPPGKSEINPAALKISSISSACPSPISTITRPG